MIEQCMEMMNSMMQGMMGGGMMNGGMMGGMMLMMVLFWILVIAGIVLLVRLLWNRTPGDTPNGLYILQERFARGEIDLEEYQERRSVLQSQ